MMMPSPASIPPPGINCLLRLSPRFQPYTTPSVLILTFLAYALFHASRKPTSIVKTVLHSTDHSFNYPHHLRSTASPLTWPLSKIFLARRSSSLIASSSSATFPDNLLRNNATLAGQKHASKGWAPFNEDSGKALLGEVDVAFLASYSLGMFFAGHLGDLLCLRWFLTVGMIGSGLCVSLFGMAYWWNVHQLSFFILVQMVSGLFQTTGWPSVVTIVANWFGKEKRGLIMGIWNAHTSTGNIIGSLIAASVLQYGWGWSFVLPGVSLVIGGVLVFLFLVVDPVIVGLPSPYETGNSVQEIVEEKGDPIDTGKSSTDGLMNDADYKSKIDEMTTPLLIDVEAGLITNEDRLVLTERQEAVGFFQAWLIPGVLPFALCLFFAKLVAYTFLYWLPFYIRHTAIQGQYFSDETAGNLSTIFDVGGVAGGILVGHISDKMNARAIVAASFIYGAIPLLLLYRAYGSVSFWVNVTLLILSGFFVNGPYALITTAVSADLGTHSSLKGNARALATVTAIIDGTGSIGAALGPFITGYISDSGWNSVFTMLMASGFISGLMLTKLVIAEVREIAQRSKHPSVRRIV